LPGEVIALTNTERTKVGDAGVVENASLARAAQNKANDMATKGYFSHVGPDGKEPWVWISEAGYQYRFAGENLAVRFDESSDVVNAWMASPSHRANIVKPVYTEIGIGVAQGIYEGVPATFVVQYFGTPAAAIAAASQESSPIASEEEISKQTTPAEVAGASTEETVVAPVATTGVSDIPASAQVPETNTSVTSARAEMQTFLRASETSQSTVGWLMGGIVTLLLLVIALTIFVHIEIQPTEMVLGGAFVTAVAISFFALNGAFVPNGAAGQSAAVSDAFSARSIMVGEAASVEVRN